MLFGQAGMGSACTWFQGCSQLAEGWQPHPPAQEGGSWGECQVRSVFLSSAKCLLASVVFVGVWMCAQRLNMLEKKHSKRLGKNITELMLQ